MTNTSDNMVMEILNISEINKELEIRPKEFISKCEAAYNNRLDKIAKEIYSDRGKTKVIMLAGPSGSGKTTTANLLSLKIKELGVNVTVVSLDDFYLTGDDAPIGKDGKRDYETVYALDIPLVRKCLSELLSVGETQIPKYLFGAGERLPDMNTVTLGKEDMIIIEGLHALNPLFTDGLKEEGIVKIFINPNGLYKLEGKTVLDDTDVRFMRRLVRDYKFRMASAELTLSMWDDVVAAEDEFITPFINDSDYFVNTAHPYEITVISKRARELLVNVDKSNPHYGMVEKMFSAINCISFIDEALVPFKSLLREFLGNGYFNS